MLRLDSRRPVRERRRAAPRVRCWLRAASAPSRICSCAFPRLTRTAPTLSVSTLCAPGRMPPFTPESIAAASSRRGRAAASSTSSLPTEPASPMPNGFTAATFSMARGSPPDARLSCSAASIATIVRIEVRVLQSGVRAARRRRKRRRARGSLDIGRIVPDLRRDRRA